MGDAEAMVEFAGACGVKDILLLDDQSATKEMVEIAIREMCARCEEDDYFVFYFAGHGVNTDDLDGDEGDGQDEAFVFSDGCGGYDLRSTVLVDDEFAEIVSESLEAARTVRVLLLCDCCH